VVREGFDPIESQSKAPEGQHNLDTPFTVGEESEDGDGQASDEALNWGRREHGGGDSAEVPAEDEHRYGSFREERNVWGSSDD
jgi:hypothetical protein